MIVSIPSINQIPACRPLSAENLAQDFGIRSGLTKECLARLLKAALRNESAYSRWHAVFSRLWGPAEHRLLPPLGALKRKAGIPDEGPPLLFLFALQTHYALLLSLLLKRFKTLRHYELTDPVFAWCFASDCPKLRSILIRIAEKMESYDLRFATVPERTTDALAPAMNSRPASDLLKSLHHSLFPRAIRHHLGEYYTPDWLAEHLLDQLEFDGRTPGRLLDPACGSGTFLMAAIRRIRRAFLRNPAATADRSLADGGSRTNGEPPSPALLSVPLILKASWASISIRWRSWPPERII